MSTRFVATAVAASLCAACGSSPGPTRTADESRAPTIHHQQHRHSSETTMHSFHQAEDWARVFDDPARDAWQRPDDVVHALELAPSMRIADVGAGTGYFAVRLARAVPTGEVLATDIEPDMVRYLGERAVREQLPNLRARLATSTASGLEADSVDRILVVNVWHHIADRVAYARDLAAALRRGGKLFVVDFSSSAQHGPPVHARIEPEVIVAELNTAGLVARISSVTLPEQYIVEASRH